MKSIVIREERPEDITVISEVTVAAFKELEMSDLNEHNIINGLREAGALSLSLVAEHEGCVVGHIAFSPVTVSDGTEGWYGLGPVSVVPKLQRRGIGGALIQDGLPRLKTSGAAGCCLVGHPEYYIRFGFSNPSCLRHEGVSPEVFFALSFNGKFPAGSVLFHEAFGI